MKALAFALALLLALPAHAQGLIYESPQPAPDPYSPLAWSHGGVIAPGFWVTEAQVQKLDLRIKYLEDRATKECISVTNTATKKELLSMPASIIAGGIGLVAGVVGGLLLAKKL